MEENQKIVRFELTPGERLAKVVEIMAEGALALSFKAILALQIPFLRLTDLRADVKFEIRDVLVSVNPLWETIELPGRGKQSGHYVVGQITKPQ